MAWQEHHVAWLKLYYQTLWKVSKTINYPGINGGLCYVKCDKMGDLIKKLIILLFSNEYGTFPFSFFLSLSLSSAYSYAQTDTHTHMHFPSAGVNVPPLWN